MSDASGPSWEKSAAGWIEQIDGGDIYRTYLLDAAMLRLAGEVRDRDVIDVGCGEGRFCRLLAERGARTTGIEPTTTLLAKARERDSSGTYVQAGAESLPVADSSFDLAILYLTLIDIAQFREAIAEIARVLRPGGSVILANLQSFATTRPSAWYRNERGEKLHMAVEEYFTERAVRMTWGKIDILNYHRPLDAYMKAFIGAGFTLTAFEEPQASAELIRDQPRMRDEGIVPLFHVMAWQKRS
jgi:SAM-dependent methyltransferase